MAVVQAVRGAGHDGPVVVVDTSEVLPHDRPPLSKQVLAGEWDLERASQPVASRLDDLEVDLRLGVGASGLDTRELTLTLADGSLVEAAGVAITTGSRARVLPHMPDGVHVLRDGSDSLALRAALDAGPDRVVVVGAGFIGAEVASVCRGRGIDVTMLEAAPVPLERVLPGGVGGFLAELHRGRGVEVRLGTPIESFETAADGSLVAVRLADGSRVGADLVVVGIGAAPNVSWLEGSGLDLLDPSSGGGVLCDETLLASPGVVAAGDVAAWPNPHFGGEVMRVEHWENAIESGTHAGRRLLAELADADPSEVEPFASVPWFWSDQYDSKIQMVGRCGPEDTPVVVDGDLDSDRFVVLFRRGDLCTAALGVSRPRLVMQARMKMADSLDWDGVAALF